MIIVLIVIFGGVSLLLEMAHVLLMVIVGTIAVLIALALIDGG